MGGSRGVTGKQEIYCMTEFAKLTKTSKPLVSLALQGICRKAFVK